MNPFVLFQSLHMQTSDAEYRYVRLKHDMLVMERRLDALDDEIKRLLAEIEHNMGILASQFESCSA